MERVLTASKTIGEHAGEVDIGLGECLGLDSHESGTVSFVTIDLRMRLLQESEPDRANKCGVPALGDMMREEKIKDTLRQMVSAGKLQRCRQADRWKILSGLPIPEARP